jgi:predicted nucleic acid-binding protein
MIRTVLETNELVSALISSRGSPRKILGLLEQDRFELVILPAILEELQRVIR